MSCSDNTLQQELEATRQELEAAKMTLSELQTRTAGESTLVHIVLFQLKPDADGQAFMAELKKLGEIAAIRELEIGRFEDLGDARALSDYSVIVEMSFADTAAYREYQQHPIHLALKDNTLAFLSGPPATYDFTKK